MSLECMITGCALRREHFEHEYAWGDLHRIGNVWVFNAVLHNGETWWTHALYPDEGKRRGIDLREFTPYFERRGVWVIEGGMELLDAAAREYLSR